MRTLPVYASLLCCCALSIGGCKNGTQAASTAGGDALSLSSGDRALQAKMQPVIGCINRTFAAYQRLRPDYLNRIAQITSPSAETRNGFPTYVSFKVEPYEQNAQYSRECADGLTKAASIAPALPQVDDPAKDASAALLAMIAPGDAMTSYLEQKAFLNDNFAKGRQLDTQLRPLLDRVVADADRLQAAVQQQEATLHQHQLDAIEKKYGRNLTWHTQRSMMAARSMNDTLVNLANSGKLTVQSAAAAEQPLQQAYDEGQAYAQAHPDAAKPNAMGGVPMWFKIDDSLSRQLGRANEVRQYVSDPTMPRERVHDDLKYLNDEFNGMVETYNLMLNNNLTTG